MIELEVIVVDNASSDGSPEMVRQCFPQVKLILSRENLGYARANNLALNEAKGDIWVLLNPDTLVPKNLFVEIVKTFGEYPDVGMVAPQLLNGDGSIQPSWGKYANVWTEFFFQFFLFKVLPPPYPLGRTIHPLQRKAYNTDHVIDWASGACLSIRREVAEKVGFLDETIFMYGEDMEWCWRVKHAGYAIRFTPEAKVIHYSRQSSWKNIDRWIENYTTGQLQFFLKHRSRLSGIIAGAFICLGSTIRISAWSILSLLQASRRNESQQRIIGYKRAINLGLQAMFTGRILSGTP